MVTAVQSDRRPLADQSARIARRAFLAACTLSTSGKHQNHILGGEDLFVGGAAGVADQGLGHEGIVRLAPDNRNFHGTEQLQHRRSRLRLLDRHIGGCTQGARLAGVVDQQTHPRSA